MNEKFLALPEERQRHILNAAISVFARYSYRHSSTDDIAVQANISKGLLFYYFGNKSRLYAYLFTDAIALIQRQMAAFGPLIRPGDDIFDTLKRATYTKGAVMKICPDAYDFLMRAYYETDPHVCDIIGALRAGSIERSYRPLAALVDPDKLRDGICPRQLLDIVLWSAEGYMKVQREQGDIYDIDGMVEDYCSALSLLKLAFYKEEYHEHH